MKPKILLLLAILISSFISAFSQEAAGIGTTIRISGKWEVNDIWYDVPVDLNVDGAKSKFAAEEYDFCSKYQSLDLSVLNGKATHLIGEPEICDSEEIKLNWYIRSQESTIMGVELEKPVIIFTNKRKKKICQAVILHTNQYDTLLYGNLPGDRFSKPALIHLSRELPSLTASRAD